MGFVFNHYFEDNLKKIAVYTKSIVISRIALENGKLISNRKIGSDVLIIRFVSVTLQNNSIWAEAY